ncbi:MAG: hypothetical protein KUG71_13085, partial [Porticoccaceae bacterium]|nr:hypothetical protein [Porticoccaceae bacterium]
MNKLFFAVLFCLSTIVNVVNAADMIDQRNIDRLVNGGATSIRSASESLYRSGSSNREVLDVVAEVLLNGYQSGGGATHIDAMAWAAKALGQSGDARYRNVLEEVLNNSSNRKLKKHTKKSLQSINSGDAAPYAKGSVSLEALRNKTAQSSPKANTKIKSSSGKKLPISEIRDGMSMQEVYELAGEPSATYSHQTGKAWIPFNFGAKDVARTVALYKGQGRVIFSLVSAYSGVYRVV